MDYSHFKGKDALTHVMETHAKGTATEPHGIEIPGHLFAATDTARLLSLFLLLLTTLSLPARIIGLMGLGMLIGLAGRSAWIGWARLERLHRNLEQEHYEIEHHRAQEREELRALYQQKGFQDPLLDQVVDVLMADDDRLLRIMLEEEMGFSLESYEHPLKQCVGALVGGFLTLLLLACVYYTFSFPYFLATSFLIIGFASGLSAFFEKNKLIPSIVWGLGIAGLSFGMVYFLS